MLEAQAAGAAVDGATADALAQAEQLCAQGLYLKAQALLPALQADTRLAAQFAATRILWHLGARRLADATVMRLWRAHRQQPEAIVEMVRTLGVRRGPYRAWQRMQACAWPADAPAEVSAEWHSLRAYTLALLRDFEAAESAHRQALALAPQDAWVHVEWAYACEWRDRHAEGLALAEQGLRLKPGYRSALQAVAHFYTLLGRDAEALQLLADAVRGRQSASLAMPLFELQMEHGLFADALQTLDRCRRYLVLADRELQQWLAARRCDVALRLGDLALAEEQARAAGGGFYTALADRLQARGAAAAPARRVVLPVGFVRQHFNTCAPATLAALSGYWQRPAPHLEIAEAICYDGTPNHSERRWAEEQGFVTREFTVDWPTATALLDAGVPFTLTTVGTGNAHLQAVIGYDELRGTLLIRDPGKRTSNEFEAKSLFESHKPFGPRGMLLVPPEAAGRIAQIVLPESALWDRYHALMSALGAHDRAAAVQAAEALQAEAPGHRLAVGAWRAIAGYDGDDATLLRRTEELLALFPHEPNLMLSKAGLLGVLGSRQQCDAWWQQVQASPGFDAVVMLRHAQFVAEDPRQHALALRQLDKVLAMVPMDAGAWHAVAGVLWARGEREAALERYRIAAGLQDTHEGWAESHFRACHALRRTEQGLAFLRARVERLGALSAGPVYTLFNQLDLLERTTEAFALLDEAIARQPDNADLRLFAADALLRYGRREAAARHLQAAQGGARRASWLRLQALLERDAGDLARALALLREAAALEPLNLELQRLIAALLSQAEGRDAALAHLQAVCAQHPHHFELQRLRLSWLPDERMPEILALLRHLVEISPHDAWAQRELAVKLALDRQHEAAWQAAQQALQLAPLQSDTHSTLGFVRLREGRIEQARAHLREAISLSVDNDYAVNALSDLDTSLQEQRATLAFVREELLRQVSHGDGLLAFQERARTVMEPQELLAVLQQAHAQRPDLWQAWLVLALQQARMGAAEQALALLGEATERFPLLPRLHVELANQLLLLGRREEARERARQALQINPAWPVAVRLYVDSVLDEGERLERAHEVLAPALRRMPRNAELRALHGWVLWRQEQQAEAEAEVRSALAADPGYAWAWDLLQHFGQRTGRPDLAAEVAETLVQQRPGDAGAWLRLARHAADPERALQAAERGLALEPRHQPLYELRLKLLLSLRRDAELEQAVDRSPWGEAPPLDIGMFKARLARAQGDMDRAVTLARQLLDRDPNHFGVWRELADWHDERNHTRAYLEAARQMVRIAPLAALAHGFLGHALLREDDREGAAEAFARAVTIDPSYGFAGLHLIDLDLQAGRLERAGETLQTLAAHDDSPYLALRRFRWAQRRGDGPLALAQAERIFDSADPAHHALAERVVQEIDEDTVPGLLQVVEQRIAAGRCLQPAVEFWLARKDRGLPGALHRAVRKLLPRDGGHALKQAYVEHLARHRRRGAFDRFVRAHRDALRSHDGCWGATGFAYLELGRHADAARWLADWAQRPGAPYWALDNLAVALRLLDQHAAARAVSERSLALAPSNDEARTWLAVDAGRADRLDELDQLLGQIDLGALRPYFRNLTVALQAYRDAVQARDSRRALSRFAALHASRDRVLQRLVSLLARRLVRRHTPAWARPWRWLQMALGWG